MLPSGRRPSGRARAASADTKSTTRVPAGQEPLAPASATVVTATGSAPAGGTQNAPGRNTTPGATANAVERCKCGWEMPEGGLAFCGCPPEKPRQDSNERTCVAPAFCECDDCRPLNLEADAARLAVLFGRLVLAEARKRTALKFCRCDFKLLSEAVLFLEYDRKDSAKLCRRFASLRSRKDGAK